LRTERTVSTADARKPGRASSSQWPVVYAASTVSRIVPLLGSVI
jgi:hypothetical protein